MFYKKKGIILLTLFMLLIYTSGIQLLVYGNSNWEYLTNMPITYLNKKHIVNSSDSNGNSNESYMIYVKDDTYNKNFYLSVGMERYYNIEKDTKLRLTEEYAPSQYASKIGLEYIPGQEFEKYSIFGSILIVISFGILWWIIFYKNK